MNEKSKWPHKDRQQPPFHLRNFYHLPKISENLGVYLRQRIPLSPKLSPQKVPNSRVRLQIPLEFLRGGA